MDGQRQDRTFRGIRASDAERDHTIAELRRHHGDGRLTWDEFSERMDKASAARVRGELEELLRDLPGPVPTRPVAARRGAGGWAPWRAVPLLPLLLLGLVLLGAVLGGGPDRHGFFFPVFPLLFLTFFFRRAWRRW